MTMTNIQQEGAAVKPIEPIIKSAPEPAVPYPRPISDTELAVRHVDLAKVSESLVTLAPAGAALNPKQQVMAEQFRLLRTRVKALSKDFQLQTMLITSTLSGEGKTTVAANLAGSLSGVEGLRVLLIDFDLRRPCLHTIFGVEPDRLSWTSWLEGKTPWQRAIYQVNRRLDVLFGFDPLEEPDLLLQSSRLEKLLNEMKAEYDVMILDSAPMLAVADTHSLVPLVDCALFVVNADNTPIHGAREALSMLQDKVAGCVVNRIQHLKSEDYYRNSGYGYGYGSKRKES
ncbi:MAG: CpsD/CapB family tyrosine-protein kinase [Terriglobia bacterium]|nr:CpsD/CapB family tyrosine-protein kinase [Terriglobia bacterium]